jgi:hypothetical protein
MFSGLSFLTTSVFSRNSSIDDGLIMRTVFFSARTGSNCPFANSRSLKEEVSWCASLRRWVEEEDTKEVSCFGWWEWFGE